MHVLLTFLYNISLKHYYNTGLIFRDFLLYKKLQEKNINFSFLTYGDKNDFQYNQYLDRIRIFPISELISSKIPKFKLIKTLIIPLKLKNLFKSVDIIKTDQVEGSWIGCVAKLIYGKKLIVRGGYESLRNYIDFSILYGYKKNLKYLYYYFKIFLYEYIAYKLADIIICTNISDIHFIVNRFNLRKKIKKIHHIYNFLDINKFKPVKTEKKEKHILRVGRLDQGKNLFNLLKAFENLRDFTLDLIGTGPFEKSLKKYANKLKININFLGIIPNNELPHYINQYQIFILPSSFEGNPKVLLEAMSCGTACIGTNVRGINDIIKHKNNGYLCETDSKSIKNAILTLYNDEHLRKQIGLNAREFILKNCELNLIAKKEYSIYKSLVK